MADVRVWFNVSFNNQGYDVGVVDPEEYSYMDLLDDLEVEGLKQSVIPAKYPIVKYFKPTEEKLVEIKGDLDLMKMFKLFSRKQDIDLYVEESENPSKGVQCWLKLKADRDTLRKKKEERDKKQREDEERKRREEEEEVIPPLSSAIPIYTVEEHGVLDTPEYYVVDLNTGCPIGEPQVFVSHDVNVGGKNKRLLKHMSPPPQKENKDPKK